MNSLQKALEIGLFRWSGGLLADALCKASKYKGDETFDFYGQAHKNGESLPFTIHADWKKETDLQRAIDTMLNASD